MTDKLTQRQNAEAFLAEIHLPDGFVPVAIVAGYDLRFMVQFFDQPMPDGENTRDTVWSQMSRIRFYAGDRGFNPFALAAAAQNRWPSVMVWDCHCTCCCDGLNLIGEADIKEYPLAEPSAARS